MAATQVWKYLAELIFNMLVLVGTIKMLDRAVKEIMGIKKKKNIFLW